LSAFDLNVMVRRRAVGAVIDKRGALVMIAADHCRTDRRAPPRASLTSRMM
jgi:hypothetical protein